MYLTYDEYLSFGGNAAIEVAAFEQLEFKARKRIDYLTDCRVAAMSEVPEAVKRAMVEIIAHENKYGAGAQAADTGALITSFNTDGYSESYGGVSEQMDAAEKNLTRSVRNLLHGELDDRGVPLLYRGVNV